MNNYTKFLADLTNMDEVIKDEDKGWSCWALFWMMIIRLSFSPLSMASNPLVTMKCRMLLWINWDERTKSPPSAYQQRRWLWEEGVLIERTKMIVRDQSTELIWRNQCAFCNERHWKVNYLKLKNKKEWKTKANIAHKEFTGGWFGFWLISCFAYHRYPYSLLLRCLSGY